MEDFPTLIEDGKRCYCESRGELMYCDESSQVHPAVANLPRPLISELQRRPKASGSANLQFLEQTNEFQVQNYLEQLKLTIEADGLLAALKGVLVYNPYSVHLFKKCNSAAEYFRSLMPQQVSAYLSNWLHQEIPHVIPQGLITEFAWHPKTNKIAVALKDDTIKIWYGDKDNVVPLLKHKRQVGINTIAWKPLVDDVLAVGCHDCAILWTVDPSSMSARPGSGCAQIISSPSNQPVHSLSWDPKSSLLALGSKNSTKIEIWDSDREELILRKSGMSCVGVLAFNPSGERLLVSGQNSLSVFHCADWRVETWSGLNGAVQLVNWSNDGNRFIFAIKRDLYCIGFDSLLGGDSEAKVIRSFSADIRQLTWHNDRLAISVQDSEYQVMLFNTQIGPSGSLRIEFIGWIPGAENPEMIEFRGSCEGGFGSILSMVYRGGEMENVPLLYLEDNGRDADKTGHYARLNRHEFTGLEESSMDLHSYTMEPDTRSYF